MVSPETVVITTKTGAGGVVRQGAQQLALLAPLDGSATIAANVVKKYRRFSDAETDHATGSAIAVGVKAALAEGIPFVFAVGVAARSGSPFTETFGTSSVVTDGTLTASRLPLTSVTSVNVDGAAKTVVYTHLDPTTQTVPAGEVWINTDTGKFKSGTATSGAGAGIVIIYASHDWNAALAKLDLETYEYHTYAGATWNAQNHGVFKLLVSHAVTENKMVAAALASGVTPASVEALVESTRSGRVFLVAAYYTGDLTSAIAAHRARDSVDATAKMSIAPRGISFTDSYLRADFGDEETPASGTFHEMGVNAIYRDRGGTYRISNDRACTGLTDFERFHSTRRSLRFCEVEIDDDLTTARQRGGRSIPFTAAGIGIVRNTIDSTVERLTRLGIISDSAVVVPDISEVTDSDKSNRVLNGVEVSVVLSGQIHMFKLALNADV